MLLERVLQSQGFGSRRGCRELIRAGRVLINGRPALEPSEELATPGLELTVDGERWRYRERVYLAMNKPAGHECSRAPEHHPSVFSLLPAPLLERGVQCVGRLDVDATGLLLLSDDGQFAHALSSPRRHVPRVYEVTAADPLDDRQLEALRAGVALKGESAPARADACTRLADRALRLTISEGRYHQVKRMLAAVGSRVVALDRVAIGALALPAGLGPGQWRYLEEHELPALAPTATRGAGARAPR